MSNTKNPTEKPKYSEQSTHYCPATLFWQGDQPAESDGPLINHKYLFCCTHQIQRVWFDTFLPEDPHPGFLKQTATDSFLKKQTLSQQTAKFWAL